MTDDAWQSVDLRGTVDLHVHSSPDLVGRSGDDLQMAREAQAAGMRAIVLKSHHTLTADRAYLCEKVLGGATRIFGGLVLNAAVGGLNPVAVDAALKLGAREIWMPTFGSRHQRRLQGDAGGISIQDDDGRIRPEVHEIVDLVAAADVLLSTGHLSPQESLALIRLARQRGVQRLLVTHPEMHVVVMSLEDQREAARLGAFLERDYVTTTHYGHHTPLDVLAHNIRAVGVESTVLATDLGQPDTPCPVEGLRRYLAGLRGLGFGEQELHTMAARNPGHLLGLES